MRFRKPCYLEVFEMLASSGLESVIFYGGNTLENQGLNTP